MGFDPSVSDIETFTRTMFVPLSRFCLKYISRDV